MRDDSDSIFTRHPAWVVKLKGKWKWRELVVEGSSPTPPHLHILASKNSQGAQIHI